MKFCYYVVIAGGIIGLVGGFVSYSSVIQKSYWIKQKEPLASTIFLFFWYYLNNEKILT